MRPAQRGQLLAGCESNRKPCPWPPWHRPPRRVPAVGWAAHRRGQASASAGRVPPDCCPCGLIMKLLTRALTPSSLPNGLPDVTGATQPGGTVQPYETGVASVQKVHPPTNLRPGPPGVGASSVTFTVNSPLDRIDDNVGDGICHTASGTCTLRAAVMEADVASSTAGATIILPAGIYSLTIPAAVPDGPENGDLNLIAGNPMISIVGAGAASTIIDANQNDRVLSVQKGRTASLSGVTLRGGSLVNDYGGGINNNGILALDRVTVSGNDAGAA